MNNFQSKEQLFVEIYPGLYSTHAVRLLHNITSGFKENSRITLVINKLQDINIVS
jgi:hypothetical protein